MCFEVWSSLNASAVKKGFFGLCLIYIPHKITIPELILISLGMMSLSSFLLVDVLWKTSVPMIDTGF